MTDNKAWLWRKRSSEKNIAVVDKVEFISKGHEEIHVLLTEKAALERDIRYLSSRLSSALSESGAKDELAKKHAKATQETLAGWEKAEAKALSLKQDVEEAFKEREKCEQRTTHLDAALKECMQQLRFVREDQEKRIHDVLLKASVELEETKIFWGQKLSESDKKIAKLIAENSDLNQKLLLKEQVTENLTHQWAKAEAEENSLLARLEGLEKDNSALRYEVRILEKEVDIRNEERKFNHRTADAAHKQHLENVKKIAKLESECQRLRVLVRKRLPGPAALAKMKGEVDILQKESVRNRRKTSNSNISNLQSDYMGDDYPDSPGRKVNTLTERICALEEEKNSLREALQQKINELQISRNMYAKTALKLSQVEAHIEQSPKGQFLGERKRNNIVSYDLSLASMSDGCSDDKSSCAGSWASALISELEHFRDGKEKSALPAKSARIGDINHFMDDFVEMEKLALVCIDKPIETSSLKKSESSLTSLSETSGKELVPFGSVTDANGVIVHNDMQQPSKFRTSVSKLIEIIEGINLSSQVCGSLPSLSGKNDIYQSEKNIGSTTGYTVRVLQWKTSDLAAILQSFLRICEDLRNGKADFDKFIEELTAVCKWIVNHCFSFQDVSNMKDEIKKQLDWHETRSESEVGGEVLLYALRQQLHSGTDYVQNEMQWDRGEGRKLNELTKNVDSVTQELEIQSLKTDCESLRNELQRSESRVASLQAELETLKHSKTILEDKFEIHKKSVENLDLQLSAVRSELDGAQQNIVYLEAELKKKVNHCKELETNCLDLQLQLKRETKLDSTAHDSQDEKQLQTRKYEQEKEISAASEKLADCQETILYLGKQLRSLASSRDAVVSDKFISTPPTTNTISTTNRMPPTPPTPIEKKQTSQRSTLLEKMLAEDDADSEQLESPKPKEIICPKDFRYEPTKEYVMGGIGKKYMNEINVGSLAIVPSKKQHTSSGGILKKFLWRKKKGSNKNIAFAFAA